MSTCSFCGDRVDESDPDDFYREVMSWVTGPKLQSPVLRSQTGRVAHHDCIQKMVKGQAPDQPTLDGDLVETVATLQQGEQSARLCDEVAVKGTGTGICGTVLDIHGECPRAGGHLL